MSTRIFYGEVPGDVEGRTRSNTGYYTDPAQAYLSVRGGDGWGGDGTIYAITAQDRFVSRSDAARPVQVYNGRQWLGEFASNPPVIPQTVAEALTKVTEMLGTGDATLTAIAFLTEQGVEHADNQMLTQATALALDYLDARRARGVNDHFTDLARALRNAATGMAA